MQQTPAPLKRGKLCTDPAHKSTPCTINAGSGLAVCNLCGGERLVFTPVDEDLDLDDVRYVASALFRRGAPKTEESALAHYRDFAQRGLLGHAQAVEEAIRAKLTERVERALGDAVDHGDFGDASGHLGCDGFRAMAGAAVDVFTEFVRNPGTIVEHDDGRAEIRWA